MRLRKARQIFKCFADDTRLRIINLLGKQQLNVTELCDILGSSQSNISKHLARLRLTAIVGDKRKGFNVYYYLRKPEEKVYGELIRSITNGLSELEIFKKDIKHLKELKR